ncbi:sucrose-6-phosphate hydrolase [Psychromonas sp. MB-3u-54]|uniref:glycoside hydrolase family 32 protein n=1 Tax=Psychromonas sp. MB-3u-54 TaxID=2058319 RepID=UPI000C34368C|nr:glycoside hydrolase family 32 protein [Psychromonas sp. MB-3u-54]PKH02761.1 sucrose-6-phosphate hydrolase [Psychromonas sp. MB-3u-54]
MSLLSIIKDCGGIHNVLRVLIPDSRIIIEIHEFELLSAEAKKQAYNLTLKQVTYQQTVIENMNEFAAQLLQVGQLISDQQRQDISAYTAPVECEFRPDWHISPPQGLLNDPNGFIYHQGQYHLFYQWYPYACVHKDKYWAHLTSKDLVNWQWQPVALTPSDWFDSHGVFSGHALSQDDLLMLFYTGNTRIGEQRDRHTTQCLATSTDGLHFTKQGPVVPELPPGVTPHCRDPKVIRHNDRWLMLLGVQREDEIGRLAIYHSKDLKTWTFMALCGDELGDFGYMWECPDFFTLNKQDFIVIGPQGINSPDKSHTIAHHNGIVKAKLETSGKALLSDFQHLDHGFDFYAPQSLQTPDGRRIMSAWMGLPDEIDHPSADNGWVHQLTTMRELSYENGALIQKPIKELQTLRHTPIVLSEDETCFDLHSKAFELQVSMQWGSVLRLHQSESGYCEIRLDSAARRLYFDRSNTLIREGDSVRELALPDSASVQLQILSDSSSLEVFINEGEAVMSARVFSDKNATQLSFDGNVKIQAGWLLNKATAPFVS